MKAKRRDPKLRAYPQKQEPPVRNPRVMALTSHPVKEA